MKPVVAMILAASVAGCLTSADTYVAENGRTSPAISQNEITKIVAMLRYQLYRCWTPPVGMVSGPPVTVSFALNQDGTLAGDPTVRPGDQHDALFRPMAESALRAVRACTPLRLPAAHYEFWREVEITFDPREMPRVRPGDVKR
jgi:colicin import membrane protein